MTVDSSGIFTELGRMSGIDSLLLVARRYEDALNIEASTVSWRVFNDSKKLDALRNGKDIQVRRLEAAMRWFSANWPEGAEWPAEVARPESARSEPGQAA